MVTMTPSPALAQVPVTTPSLPADQPPAANDVVSQALAQAGKITQAANTSFNTDPYAGALAAALKQTEQAKADALPQVQANAAERARLMAEPLAPLPTLPTLQDIPEPPPAQLPANPLRTIGQFLPVLAALGSGAVRGNATAALNAATGALNAAHASDQELLKQNHDSWLEHSQRALQQNQIETDKYRNILESRKFSMDEKLSRIQALAASSQDAITMATLRSGNVDGISKLVEMRDTTAKQYSEVVNHALEQKQKEAELAEQAKYHAGELAARARETDVTASHYAAMESQGRQGLAQRAQELLKVDPNDVIGRILNKVANDGTPTAGEESALKKWAQLHAATDPMAQLMGSLMANKDQQAAGGGAKPDVPAGDQPPPKAVPPPQIEVDQASGALRRGIDRATVKGLWVKRGHSAQDFDRLVK